MTWQAFRNTPRKARSPLFYKISRITFYVYRRGRRRRNPTMRVGSPVRQKAA
jgi:hypothetical protein